MADDGFPSASSARARRSRSTVGAAAQPVQRALGSGIDDFLGGGRAPAPAPEPTKQPEPGGWVSDKSGVENYEQPLQRKADVDPIGDGGSFKVNMGEFRAAAQRAADGAPFEMPPGSVQKQAPSVPRQPVPELSQAEIEAATARAKPSASTQDRGRFPKADAEVAKAQADTMQAGALDESLTARKTNSPEVHPAYARIIRTTFAFNPDAVFDELEAAMRLPKPMRDMGYLELAELLDQASRHHVNASKLHADAKVKLALFDADCLAINGDMRRQATAQLKAEKDEAKGGKMITEGDVESRIAQIFPDEFRRQTKLKNEMKTTVGHLETFVKSWELRRRELDTMLRECRKG